MSPRSTGADVGAAGAEGALPPEAWILALLGLDRMGPARLRPVLAAATPAAAWEAVRAGRLLELVPALRRPLGAAAADTTARWRAQAAGIDPAVAWAAHRRRGIAVLAIADPRLPDELRDDPEPPALLFARGDLAALDGPRVAIVGTRDATHYGTAVARALGRDLAAAGVRVVSGLALGIDGAAHAAALEVDGVPPVGVVGSGLDVVYPRRHRALWEQVAGRGLLLSEYPLGTPPEAWRFPARNRIVAALADAVVIVESAELGGSMLTASLAVDRDRPVLAVPGPVTSRLSDGPNQLLATGLHPMARDAGDVLAALEPARLGGRAAALVRPPAGEATAGGGTAGALLGSVPPRTAEEDEVLAGLGWAPATLDHLQLRLGRGVLELAAILGRLEAEGVVARRGGWYERVARSDDLPAPRRRPRGQAGSRRPPPHPGA